MHPASRGSDTDANLEAWKNPLFLFPLSIIHSALACISIQQFINQRIYCSFRAIHNLFIAVLPLASRAASSVDFLFRIGCFFAPVDFFSLHKASDPTVQK